MDYKIVYQCCEIFLQISLEGLPVSSSTHGLLIQRLFTFFDLHDAIVLLPHYTDHVLHGAVIIMLVIFFKKSFVCWALERTHAITSRHASQKSLYQAGAVLARWILFFSITTACTAAWYGMVKGLHLFAWWCIPLGYTVTTTFLLSLYWNTSLHGLNRPSVLSAVCIGTMQGIALLPGVSRLGVTYAMARWCGFSAIGALYCSFAAELPISIAACAKGIIAMTQAETIQQLLHPVFVCTTLSALGVGILGLYGMWHAVRANTVWMFGIYTGFLTIITYVVGL